MEEREAFLDRAGGHDDMRDLHDLGAAVKNEHLEIAGHENLVMLARKLDVSDEVLDPLTENRDEEQRTKKRLKAMADDSTVRRIFTRLAG